MAETTGIKWTDATFNPWEGCQRVSPGCENCYAEARANRFQTVQWGPKGVRRVTSKENWRKPLRWNREAQQLGVRRRVFCASLADVFEDRPELVEPRALLFSLIEATPFLDWQVLTKRPQNMLRLAPERWAKAWPSNVWAGTTTESQHYADTRIPELLKVPAMVRFLSVEPQLEHVTLALAGISWVIVGGESGAARPFDLAWGRSVVAQCEAAGVAVFVKQLGAVPTEGLVKLRLKDRMGGDMTEWPESLRVRSFPAEEMAVAS